MATPDDAKSSTASSGNRDWTLDNADTSVRVKPRRPYTPYNLFYLLERELVVQGHEPSVAKEASKKKTKILSERSLINLGKRPEEDIAIPSRYKNVVLLPFWYEPNLKEKRKHRKTHGKVSFKDLTGIISKNWANIDVETKDFCTRISQIGRKRYKETITRYNAAQKIIQLKKEREQRLDQSKKNICVSPPRSEKGHHSKPDRVVSCHAPIVAHVVTPPRSGYNDNRNPTFVPSFHQYGPPPPLPPPMPQHCMSGQHPPSMPMYHHQQQQHLYCYSQAPAMHNLNNNGYNQAFNSNNNGYNQGFESNNSGYHGFNSNYGQNQSVEPSSLLDKRRGNNLWSSNQGIGGAVDVRVRMNKEETQGIGGAVDVHVRMKKEENQGSGAVDVHVRTERENKTGMTHDEALRLCDLIGSDAPFEECGHEEPQMDLIGGISSFDFGDHYSISSEDEAELSKDFSFESLINEVEDGDDISDIFDQDQQF